MGHNQKSNNNYLTGEKLIYEATYGNFKYNSEDRLTQVVVAAFNSSKMFRIAFCKFIGLRYQDDFKCKSQVAYKDSRPDFQIFKLHEGKELPICNIENKVESSVNIDQIKRHKKANIDLVLITKYRSGDVPLAKNNKLIWSNFYELLSSFEKKMKNNHKDPMLTWIKKYMEEVGLKKCTEFTGKEASEASKLVHFIRFYNKTSDSSSFNSSGLSYLSKISDTVLEASEIAYHKGRQSKSLKKLISKPKGSSKLKGTYWISDLDGVRKSGSYDQLHKNSWLMIGQSIPLKTKVKCKTSEGEVYNISHFAINITFKNVKRVEIFICYETGGTWDKISEVTISPSKTYTAEYIADLCLKEWSKFLNKYRVPNR